MTTSRPLAVLRVKFKDRVNTQPSWTDFVYDQCFLPRHPLGLADYWESTTFNFLDLSGSRVFPWITIDMDLPTAWVDRHDIIPKAVQAARDAGHDLTPYFGIVVFAIPNSVSPTLDTGGASFYTIDVGDGIGRCGCLLTEDTDHDFYAHEVGHALGLHHSFSETAFYTPDNGLARVYGDPSDIMSGRLSLWSAAADPAFPVPGTYLARMGTRASGATMYCQVPGFDTSAYVYRRGASVQPQPETLRLHALDTGRKPCVVAVDYPNLGKTTYTLEYRRRSAGWWDSSVPEGVTIHTIDVDLPSGMSRSVYRTVIPVPLISSQRWWRDPHENLAVVVEAVADDGSWVDVTIGGAGLVGREASIRVSNYMWEREEGERGFDRVPVPPGCTPVETEWYTEMRTNTVTLEADAIGYKDPEFSYVINGVPIQPGKPDAQVTALSRYPTGTGTTSSIRQASLSVNLNGARLAITTDPTDGNYTLHVTVEVNEKNAGGNLSLTMATMPVPVVGMRIQYEQKYYDAVEACVRTYKDIGKRFSESQNPAFSIVVDPPRGIAAISRLARLFEDAHREVSDRFLLAAEVLDAGSGAADQFLSSLGPKSGENRQRNK